MKIKMLPAAKCKHCVCTQKGHFIEIFAALLSFSRPHHFSSPLSLSFYSSLFLFFIRSHDNPMGQGKHSCNVIKKHCANNAANKNTA